MYRKKIQEITQNNSKTGKAKMITASQDSDNKEELFFGCIQIKEKIYNKKVKQINHIKIKKE